jgi:hypothetical protein
MHDSDNLVTNFGPLFIVGAIETDVVTPKSVIMCLSFWDAVECVVVLVVWIRPCGFLFCWEISFCIQVLSIVKCLESEDGCR